MMKIEDYQALAMRTSPEDHDRVLNGCLGLIGESGEIVDVVKKWKFQSGENAELPKDKLIDECGDVLWYCAEVCEGLEIDLARVIREEQELWPGSGFIDGDDLPYWAYALSTHCHWIYSEYYWDNGSFHPKPTYPDTLDSTYPDASDCYKEIAPIAYPAEIKEAGEDAWRYYNIITSKIARIVMIVQQFLHKFADASLEEAMERNIEKLKKRYPDGFDPKRSLHRPEYEKAEES